MLNMVRDMGGGFNDRVLPALHKADDSNRREPGSCRRDANKHCKNATSQIHCLGQHSNDISDACRKDVGKSVPFACSESIDRLCNLLETSILSCLWQRKQSLNGECL